MIYLFSNKGFVLGNYDLCDPGLLVKMARAPRVTLPTGYLYPPVFHSPA